MPSTSRKPGVIGNQSRRKKIKPLQEEYRNTTDVTHLTLPYRAPMMMPNKCRSEAVERRLPVTKEGRTGGCNVPSIHAIPIHTVHTYIQHTAYSTALYYLLYVRARHWHLQFTVHLGRATAYSTTPSTAAEQSALSIAEYINGLACCCPVL